MEVHCGPVVAYKEILKHISAKGFEYPESSPSVIASLVVPKIYGAQLIVKKGPTPAGTSDYIATKDNVGTATNKQAPEIAHWIDSVLIKETLVAVVYTHIFQSYVEPVSIDVVVIYLKIIYIVQIDAHLPIIVDVVLF